MDAKILQLFEILFDKLVAEYLSRVVSFLQILKYNLEYSKKGFSYTALKAWNDIPVNIRELPTLCQYKKQLKSHLMS